MLTLIFVLALYSVLILLFVPLDKISKAQLRVKKWWKDLKDKAAKAGQ